MTGKLSIVATPLGNLGDMTARAKEVLAEATVVLCEDTRVTRPLLTHFGITTPTESYHQHSGAARTQVIIERLGRGEHLALVTDAGTPGISDPGNVLIGELVTQLGEAVEVVAVPGPSAVVAALSISGMPTDKFLFLGFPPHKKGRQTFMREVAHSPFTTVFYESNHRIEKCLKELAAVLEPDRAMCVMRELTKKFESVYRGTITEIMAKKIPAKGEFVVIISGKRN